MKKEPIYNLVFGNWSDVSSQVKNSPLEFIIFDYKFIRVKDFEQNIKNLYHSASIQETLSISSSSNIYGVINSGIFHKGPIKIKKDSRIASMKLEKIAQRIGEMYKKETISEKIGAHQYTYDVELPKKEFSAVINKDGTYLDDILTLLSVFTGYRVLKHSQLGNFWQKTNLPPLEFNCSKICENIEAIITNFTPRKFKDEGLDKAILFYLELNSVYSLELNISVLGTVSDYLSSSYYKTHLKKFHSFMNQRRKREKKENDKPPFAKRLSFLLEEVFLKNENIKFEEKFHEKTCQFVKHRNSVVHECRIFPAVPDPSCPNKFILDPTLDETIKSKYKRLFPFTKGEFTSDDYHKVILSNLQGWKEIYTYTFLKLLGIDKWYFKNQTVAEINQYLNS